jgi:hypothetical protein
MAMVLSSTQSLAQTPTPIHGHYPPGQTGLRGAASPSPGWTITNFNRLFSNLELKDQAGNTSEHVGEARYANITMIGWTSSYEIVGMSYGALVGIPFATGNLNPESDDLGQGGFDLGDIIVTPVALYGSTSSFDYTGQLSVWTPTGRFKASAPDNRGSGFWSLIYSAGGVWYPDGNRAGWSLSAIARIEQNFEQWSTRITPGDNLDIDWGVSRMVRLGDVPLDIGVSGFATWQISDQSGGQNVGRYRYYGIGPEVAATFAERWTVRIRAQWEFAARNAVQGNNLWFIVNYRI